MMVSVLGRVAVCITLFWATARSASIPIRRGFSHHLYHHPDVSNLMSLFERPYATHQTEYDIEFVAGTSTQKQKWSLPKGRVFSHFSPVHRREAKELLDIFRNFTTPDELWAVAQSVRYSVNENLFVFVLAHAIMENRYLRGTRLPSIVEIFPQKFVPASTIGEMYEKAQNAYPGQDFIMTEYGPEFTGTHARPEHRVAYWREDYAINEHHWHWHLVNPFFLVVDRDRKGELFYYMHQQMVARYDMERLSVGLVRVQKFSNWGEAMSEGYFSKLTVNNTGTAWGTRQDNSVLRDCNRELFTADMSGDVQEMQLYNNRIIDAIHQGALMDREGRWVPLTDDIPADQKRGIELLGDAFEASPDRSVNFPYYGEVHNYGHLLISAVNDPDYSHKEELGVMSDPTVAVRDPIFFRWHKYVDYVFQKYKLSQRPYTLEELAVDWATVEHVSLKTYNARRNATNQLYTGWSSSIYNASKGIDFHSQVSMMLNLTHLDHKPFTYYIQVNNTRSQRTRVTVRIFLAPKYNERQLDMDYGDQRSLWAEMDKFVYKLRPGRNVIKRPSLNSSVTNIYQYSHDFYDDPDDVDWKLHGCGWPQHLLLPRGSESGMAFQVFVMLTNYSQDEVVQPPHSRPKSNAASLCGVKGGKFPDSRPMGFPFDRTIKDVTSAIDLTKLPNIAMQDITITFTNSTVSDEVDYHRRRWYRRGPDYDYYYY